jgi:hypothetical protein
MLEPFGIKKWLAKKRPLSTKETAANRYKWAKEYSKWSVTEWSNVLFSDECSVERGASHMRKYVFRSAGQQFDGDKVTNHNKSKDIRVMVWAAISTAGLSDLMMMRRDSSAEQQGSTTRSYLQGTVYYLSYSKPTYISKTALEFIHQKLRRLGPSVIAIDCLRTGPHIARI